MAPSMDLGRAASSSRHSLSKPPRHSLSQLPSRSSDSSRSGLVLEPHCAYFSPPHPTRQQLVCPVRRCDGASRSRFPERCAGKNGKQHLLALLPRASSERRAAWWPTGKNPAKYIDKIYDDVSRLDGSNEGVSAPELYIGLLLLYNKINQYSPGKWVPPPTKAQVDKMLQNFDYNQDRVLNREEFQEFCKMFLPDVTKGIFKDLLTTFVITPSLVYLVVSTVKPPANSWFPPEAIVAALLISLLNISGFFRVLDGFLEGLFPGALSSPNLRNSKSGTSLTNGTKGSRQGNGRALEDSAAPPAAPVAAGAQTLSVSPNPGPLASADADTPLAGGQARPKSE